MTDQGQAGSEPRERQTLSAVRLGDDRRTAGRGAARCADGICGVEAKGGSVDGAGPVVAGGMLFSSSGFPRTGGMPVNVLLAFVPEE